MSSLINLSQFKKRLEVESRAPIVLIVRAPQLKADQYLAAGFLLRCSECESTVDRGTLYVSTDDDSLFVEAVTLWPDAAVQNAPKGWV